MPCDSEAGLDDCPYTPSPGRNALAPENLEAWELYAEARTVGWNTIALLRTIQKDDDELIEKILLIEDFMKSVNQKPAEDQVGG